MEKKLKKQGEEFAKGNNCEVQFTEIFANSFAISALRGCTEPKAMKSPYSFDQLHVYLITVAKYNNNKAAVGEL